MPFRSSPPVWLVWGLNASTCSPRASTTSVRLLESAASGSALEPFCGHTDLFIRPPYQFKAVDVLMTNFHLPRTTLLVLVRTFGGDALIMRAYEEAVRQEYRFYSYGDAMLIL